MRLENHPLEKLIGQFVRNIRVSDSAIFFQTKDFNYLVFEVEGDCCSESWFSDIDGAENVIDEIVTGLEELDTTNYNVDDGRCREDYDEAYGVTSVTNRGKCNIYFRNSSNGYYGGWMNEGTVVNDARFLHTFASVENEWHNV